jgi:hypothetical protein
MVHSGAFAGISAYSWYSGRASHSKANGLHWTQVMNMFRICVRLLEKERRVSSNGVTVLLLSVQF